MGGSGDESDSEGVVKVHTPESLETPGSLRALCYWCLVLGSPVHQAVGVPLHCHLEEEAGSSGLFHLQSLLLQEHLHS